MGVNSLHVNECFLTSFPTIYIELNVSFIVSFCIASILTISSLYFELPRVRNEEHSIF